MLHIRQEAAGAPFPSIERRPRRGRRVLASVAAAYMLTGCVGDSEVYVPLQADDCAIVSSPAMDIEYEADRWADGLDDRRRLEQEIEMSVDKNNEGPRYAVCIDSEGEAHATDLAPMDNLKRYFGYSDEGFSAAGTISVPALLEQDAFTEQFQTVVDADHGF